MTKFDEYIDEYVDDVGGMTIKRRHTMSLPRVEALRKVFDDIYQRGYDDAIRQAIKPKSNEAA